MSTDIETGFPTFAEFFSAVSGGHAPYPWQEALAERAAGGNWPAVIEVPTGLGKTASIAVALYELARQCHMRSADISAGRSPAPRAAPQRIFHVVNRRVLVDATGDYAKRLAEAINTAEPGSVLYPVRTALGGLLGRGDTIPVVATHIHGASATDPGWLRATGCVIVSLTPHQLVSRLLMRGFGVSNATRPIHAGLVGVDRLVLLDEPHLAVPSLHAIADADALQPSSIRLGIPRGSVTVLGATVPRRAADAVGATEATTLSLAHPTAAHPSGHPPHPEMERRLNARRALHLHPPSGAGDSAYVRAIVQQTRKTVRDGGKSVGVFVNTVALAQQVFAALREQLPDQELTGQVRLLTSRFRGLERPPIAARLPGITVTTQCLEVGVDVSFDAVVTELCSWDALVQRLGRLNRDGALEDAHAHMVVAADKVRAGTKAVYGEDAGALGALLTGTEEISGQSDTGIDVSIAGLLALNRNAASRGLTLTHDQQRIGTLHRGLMPLMVQTRPAPRPDIPVEAFIAGPDASQNTEVLVAWRSRLDLLTGSPAVHETEYVTIPRNQLMAFVRGLKSSVSELTDLDVPVKHTQERGSSENRLHLSSIRVWNAAAEAWKQPESDADVGRAMAVILSADAGGYDPALGWTGSPASEVPDISVLATLSAAERWLTSGSDDISRPSTLAITASTMAALSTSSGLRSGPLNLGGDRPPVREPIEELASLAAEVSEFDTERDPVAADNLGERAADAASRLFAVVLGEHFPARALPRFETFSVDRTGIVLTVSWPARVRRNRTLAADDVLLEVHLRQVAAWAHSDAVSAGIRDDLTSAVATAGYLHDGGKADPAFQRYLSGDSAPHSSDAGIAQLIRDDTGAQHGDLLAKSRGGDEIRSRLGTSERRRWRRAGLPDHWRHENESLRRIPDSTATSLGRCLSLVLHLVGSHHGWYRPALPVAGPDQTEGFSHAGDFLRLNEEFGPWGLAYVEALLRLADWRASASPITGDGVDAAAEDQWRGLGDTGAGARQAIEPSDQGAPNTTVAVRPGGEHRETELLGLISSPLTGWFASFGLLAAAARLGDADATIRWTIRDGAVAPQVPVLGSRFNLDEIARSCVEWKEWTAGNDLVASVLDVEKGLGRKNQKLAPVSRLRELLELAVRDEQHLVTGLVGDLGASEGSEEKAQIALPVVPWANNSSYPSVALKRVRHSSAVTSIIEALTDPNAGFEAEPCDGGMDRSAGAVPLVNGVGGAGDTRITRAALAPLAVFGMAHLGHTGAQPFGVVGSGASSRLRVPIPTRATRLDELRAVLATVWSGVAWDWNLIGGSWVMEFDRVKKGEADIYWRGSAVPRK